MSYKQLASNLLATCWQPAGNFFFSCKGTRSNEIVCVRGLTFTHLRESRICEIDFV
jgi:hypothetical protein